MSNNAQPILYSVKGYERRYTSIYEAIDEYLYRTEPALWEKSCPIVVHRWHAVIKSGGGLVRDYYAADLPLDTFTCVMCRHPKWAEDQSLGEHLVRITVLK